jgi:ATP-dependent DNA helicase RecQ
VELERGLRALGYDAFRPGQRDAIAALLEVGRLLLVAPTGGGKSLIYQLPGSLLDGTTLVISPLVALMHDQVAALSARGVPSTYLAATLEPDEMRRRLSGLAHGEYKLVYVAPERLAFEGFRAMLSRLECPLVAIDEAHCITDWGHDFRPDYLRIRDLLQALPRARVLACTFRAPAAPWASSSPSPGAPSRPLSARGRASTAGATPSGRRSTSSSIRASRTTCARTRRGSSRRTAPCAPS